MSTRSVAVTSSFTGTEIVIFGSVSNSRQETAESGLYDVVIVVEGTNTPLVARRKTNVAGLWINTQSATFSDVPSYYAIASTRPIEEIADTHILFDNAIGFDHVRMTIPAKAAQLSPSDLTLFKQAVVRRKQAENLYQKRDYGVVFIGRSLFRATISLPANVPVGPMTAETYLFRDGKLLSSHKTRVLLQREGIERLMHSFAFDQPLLYGIFAVVVAVLAGLAASAVFKRGSH
ncbi:MAG: TIGR02186 family protein [Hyphomicrobiaceae bacterium]